MASEADIHQAPFGARLGAEAVFACVHGWPEGVALHCELETTSSASCDTAEGRRWEAFLKEDDARDREQDG